MKTIETSLFCSRCGIETDHAITYAGEYLKEIECLRCGHTVSVNSEELMDAYKEDFVKRVLTKPRRITREWREDYKKFLVTIPIRVMTKPGRVAKEVRALKEESEK